MAIYEKVRSRDSNHTRRKQIDQLLREIFEEEIEQSRKEDELRNLKIQRLIDEQIKDEERQKNDFLQLKNQTGMPDEEIQEALFIYDGDVALAKEYLGQL